MVAYNKQINKALTNYKAKFCKQTNHLSMMMFCGFVGRGASFSMITFLAGGSCTLPGIVITFCGYDGGEAGGCSLTIRVSDEVGWSACFFIEKN